MSTSVGELGELEVTFSGEPAGVVTFPLSATGGGGGGGTEPPGVPMAPAKAGKASTKVRRLAASVDFVLLIAIS